MIPTKGKTNTYFEKIKESYNYPLEKWYYPLVNSVRAEINETRGKVLDVGCGWGIAGSPELACWTVEGADEVVGVDPALNSSEAPDHLDSFVSAPLSEAGLPEGHFDVAYSFMVMEHIEDPGAFFLAMRRTLRPGGSYIFMTPNPRSAFGLSVRVSKHLGKADEIKSLLKGNGLNHELGYNLTSESEIRQYAEGFRCEFAYSEAYMSYKSYFPIVIRPIWGFLKLKRRYWKKPNSLAQLTARCVRIE